MGIQHIHLIDPELQAALARLGLSGFSTLLNHVPDGEALNAGEMGAIVRLLTDAAKQGEQPR